MDFTVLSDVSIRTYVNFADLPPVDVIEKLYAAASQVAPLNEPAEVARSFAQLYGYATQRDDAVGVGALAADELVGFAYGYPWSWKSETDDWSKQLRDRLGLDSADRIEESFAVLLLAVHPSAAHRGFGAELLESLMTASKAKTHWLQTTDKETPALRLCRRLGYRVLGHGPDAPDGRPGLILVHTPTETR